MSKIALRVEHVGKRYRIGSDQNDKARPGQLTYRLFSAFQYLTQVLREPTEEETLWALRDVSFEVNQGEILGIIGHNGAGKSTLLKLISRITQPTNGRIELYGRVGSMLEVGTGFHPELTGRENVYVNGAILGMTPDEINKKFDAIVEFSGVEKFLDTMVKYYSSGMYVRLAFAVAAYLEPEILIVDEVLSIGDADFQSKCLTKMEELTKGGRTILFVSHNMAAIKSLCPTTILLDKGSIAMRGQTDAVLESYLKTQESDTLHQEWSDPQTAPGNDLIRIRRIWINSLRNDEKRIISRSTPLEVGVEYWNQTETQMHISLHFMVQGNIVVFASSPLQSASHAGPGDIIRSVCIIPAKFLNPGFFYINILAYTDKNLPVFTLKYALYFDVHDEENHVEGWFSKEPGIVSPALNWQTRIIGLGDQG